jgi:hypothetical protein
MKQSGPKAITISSDLAARYINPDQFKRFDAAVMKVLSVPIAEIVRREAKTEMALHPRKRGRKPKSVSRVPGVSPLS